MASDYRSTPAWFVHGVVSTLTLAVAFALLLQAASYPAIRLVGSILPAATPYLWLALFGAILNYATLRLDEPLDVTPFVEHALSLQSGERVLYVGSLLLITIAVVGGHVSGVGLLAWALETLKAPTAAVAAVALLAPAADGYLGRRLGIGFAAGGAVFGGLAVQGLGLLYQGTRVPGQLATADILLFVAQRR